MMPKTRNEARQSIAPATKDAIGMPKTMSALMPVKTTDTARDERLGSTEAAASDMARDQNTGWMKAGSTRSSSSQLKEGAAAEATFEATNSARTPQRHHFLFNPEVRRVMNGPDTATARAKPLSNQPALSIEIPNVRAIWGRTPMTPSSVVMSPKAPRAST